MNFRRELAEQAEAAEVSLWELAERAGIRKTERLCRYLNECALGRLHLPRNFVILSRRSGPTQKSIRLQIIKALSVAKLVQVGRTKEYPDGLPDYEIERFFKSTVSAVARIEFQIEQMLIHRVEKERLREARSKGGRTTGDANHKEALIRRGRILSLRETFIAAGVNPRRIVSRIAKAEGITPRRVRQVLAEEESHKS